MDDLGSEALDCLLTSAAAMRFTTSSGSLRIRWNGSLLVMSLFEGTLSVMSRLGRTGERDASCCCEIGS